MAFFLKKSVLSFTLLGFLIIGLVSLPKGIFFVVQSVKAEESGSSTSEQKENHGTEQAGGPFRETPETGNSLGDIQGNVPGSPGKSCEHASAQGKEHGEPDDCSSPSPTPIPTVTPTPTLTVTPTPTPSLCTTTGHENLTGSIDLAGNATVANSSENCIYKVGLASYKMFDSDIDHQILFDSRTATIEPGRSLTLQVAVPDCAYQIDLFQGEVLSSLSGGVRYGSRLITSRVVFDPPPFCEAPTPTPTPTVTPTPTPTVTSTVTLTPTPTPTSSPNEEPECLGLSASPTKGGAVLTVNFTGSGSDSDGKIMAFEFNFGDGQSQVIEKDAGGSGSQSVSHPFGNAGIFNASLRVRDNNGEWSETGDNCKVKIEVEGEVLAAQAVSSQPKTGVATYLTLGLGLSGLGGAALKRFLQTKGSSL